jgi:hypothetical protein
MAELIPITDINNQEMAIGDVYELHFTIQNIFQEIAGWLAPQWSEQQKKDKINTLIQKVLDESIKQKWFRILKYNVDGNDLILTIGISQLPTGTTTIGQLEILPVLLVLLPEIIVSIGLAVGVTVAVNKVFKVVEKPPTWIILGAIGLGALYIFLGRKR